LAGGVFPGLALFQLGDLLLQLLLLSPGARQIAAQQLDLLLQLEHAATHLRVLVHQAVLRSDGLVEALAQVQDGLARLVVAEQLGMRRPREQHGTGQRQGAQQGFGRGGDHVHW